jgi:hypothetical protein
MCIEPAIAPERCQVVDLSCLGGSDLHRITFDTGLLFPNIKLLAHQLLSC